MDKTILIVDDMEINRAILAEGFKDDYNIIEASDGIEALKIINSDRKLSAVLLDLVMPKMNGIELLTDMKNSGRIKQIPVFVITAQDDNHMLLDAYELGAVDVIMKPFIMNFVRCRIDSIIELYMHRNGMARIIDKQVRRLNRQNKALVEALASIIEFRDCESGEHVKRIGMLTEILAAKISEMYPEYYVPEEEITKISTAAILHDIGKISIPDRILCKPGRLDKEEFEIMKQHTVKGCEILENMPRGMIDKEVYAYSFDICRHHHERWDGKGYPDGLKGDDISIWAQIVSIADVYDALTSPRVYKAAFEHEKAVEMILNGECGTFNPKIIEVFKVSLDTIRQRYKERIPEDEQAFE